MSEFQPVVRCAIYTRKSTEEGLEQEFNTLQAQREAAEAYILSQKQNGWYALAQRYEDGGFSGASLDRPALQQLLADIQARKVDCIVVYKVDRLSRSLLDFARLLSLFEKRDVSFVSARTPDQLERLCRIGDAGVQYQYFHGPVDVPYPAVLCPVRAGDHR